MPIYVYHGRDAGGNLRTGERLANSADNLSTHLLKEGITPISIIASKKIKNVWRQLYDKLFEKKITLDELGMFARQMHLLTKSGVVISNALKRLAENVHNNAMSTTLYGMVEKLEAGQDLASSMQSYTKVFSPLMISIIRVGQSSGRLEEAFLRINQYIELETGTKKNIKTALRYPMFVFIAIISAIIIINIFVIPAFANVFTQTHMQLPLATRMLIVMSDFLIQYWIYIGIAIVVLIVGLWRYLKTPRGKMIWHKYQLQVPVLGKLLKRVILLRFTQTFTITINSGVPLIDGIELAGQSISNEYIRHQILKMRKSIEHGNTLPQAAAQTNMFTPLELQILTVSEETGELGPMLEQITAFNKGEVEYDIKRLSDIIEPLSIVALAIMILILALAVYLPIWDMVNLAHGT
jgi:MSHA biogenesis protein MshG